MHFNKIKIHFDQIKSCKILKNNESIISILSLFIAKRPELQEIKKKADKIKMEADQRKLKI